MRYIEANAKGRERLLALVSNWTEEELAPWTAAVLAVMLLASIAFHIKCRESSKAWVSLILFAMAAFVAYGRWVLAP